MNKQLRHLLLVFMISTPPLRGLADIFSNDTAFLQQHTPVIVLSDRTGQAQIVLAPSWQGRVMTSTAQGSSGQSFGWINRELIASGKLQPHINVFGGEDGFGSDPKAASFRSSLRKAQNSS